MKSTGVGGEERGYDGAGKHIKGRKRHILVDTEGLLLKVKVHAANVFDRDGIKLLLDGARELFPRISHLWLDASYSTNGQEKGANWVEKVLGWSAEIVKGPSEASLGVGAGGRGAPTLSEGFHSPTEEMARGAEFFVDGAEPHSMSKDYERVPESSEAFMYAAMSRLMVRRLARS